MDQRAAADAELELHAQARARRTHGLVGRDRVVAPVLGGGFLVAAVATALEGASRPSPLIFLALIVAYAATAAIEFEVGTGGAVPTQLVFVPMLFILPLGFVPSAVGLGYVLSLAFQRSGEERRLGRALVLLSSSWYVFGPVAVLAIVGVPTTYWRAWPILLLAFTSQCALDAIIASAHERIVHDLRARVLAPFLVRAYIVDALLTPVGLVAAYAAAADALAFALVLPTAALLWTFARDRRRHLDEALGLSSAYRGIVILLGDLIDNDDAYTGSHSRDVVERVLAVADEMNLPATERRDAEFVALLHDVGKIKIPNEILNKPGPLTDAERRIMNGHTIEGEKILATVGGSLSRIGTLVRACHERWDGEGYPDGLRGNETPLIARIVCCCDAYNAITTDRPYRAARSADDAIAEILRSAGTHFDPNVAASLARVVQSTRHPRAGVSTALSNAA